MLDVVDELAAAHRCRRRDPRLVPTCSSRCASTVTSTRCTCVPRAAPRRACRSPSATEHAGGVRARRGRRHDGRLLVAAVRVGRGGRGLPPALPHRRSHRRRPRARLSRSRTCACGWRRSPTCTWRCPTPPRSAAPTSPATRPPTSTARSIDMIEATATIETNGIRMHVAEAGPADGPPVVLCHGFPECWYSWRHQLQALGDAGYHVLAPDQRGYGTTDMPDEVDEYTQLHSSATSSGCSTRPGSSAPSSSGHDWGGPVAWHYRVAPPRPVPRRRRAERPLRRRRVGADPAGPAHRRDAGRARRLVPLHPLLPGAGRRRA